MENEITEIKTVDENGEEITLYVHDIVIYDEQEYAILTKTDSPEEEVVLMRLKTEGEDYIFEEIEDDDEFDLVSQAIMDDKERAEETAE
ncbi:DUF1292 domain-containing protein [bacterium]|nr:DUF1292 domain-containing protein [bacterium]